MPMSRAKKIMTLALVTASLGATAATASPGSRGKGATKAKTATVAATAATGAAATTASPEPAQPLLAANGRPACGNVLAKSGSPQRDRRAQLKTNLAALAKLVEAPKADTQAERDALIVSIRHGLEQLEACDSVDPPKR
jgi:hypothetical protein